MRITIMQLESSYYHIRGECPCNWAQPPTPPPYDEATLREHAFPEASDAFIRAVMAPGK